MNEKEISEINKYCDPHSVLIVTNRNKLVRLKCPFKVQVICNIVGLQEGEIVFVESVKINLNLNLVYLIKDKYYHYRNFMILFKE